MTKYMSKCNFGKCLSCGVTGRYEEHKETNEMTKIGELLLCSGCESVQYCCKEHQVKDWPKHKKFCERFRKLIVEYKAVRDNRPRHSPKPAKPTPYPLQDIIMSGDWQGLLQYLVNNPKYDVNVSDDDSPNRMAPLFLACLVGQIKCVEILLNHGATFTNVSSTGTPLTHHDNIVKLLINRGVDVNKTTTNSGLGFAATHLKPSVIELLIRHGENVHQRDTISGWTPLMHAVTGSKISVKERSDQQKKEEDVPKIISIVKMLLEAGADINARGSSSFESYDYEGDTALNLCCDNDKMIKVVELLLSSGALLDVQRKSDGKNALLVAAEHNNVRVVELLIRAGADTTLRDCKGRNYIDLLKRSRGMVSVSAV
jgi:ankyrin repeat protein